jgi:putative nucleotidyltransferase with HDIG domain
MTHPISGFALREEDLIAIPVDTLKPNTPINFNLYASIHRFSANTTKKKDLILFACAPSSLHTTEPEQLQKCGISSFFIRPSDQARYKSYISWHNSIHTVDHNETPEFRISQIQDIGTHLMEACFLTGLDDVSLSRLTTVADDIVRCLEDDPRAVVHLRGLVDHDMYTYFHSTGVGILSVAMAKALGESKHDVLRDFALGGLLHDVGKRKTPLHVLNKKSPLLDSEWALMKKHPEDGFSDIKDLKVSQRVRDIILYHHEKLDGSGYPYGLTGSNIPMEAQLVSIADIFNALTTTRCYQNKRSRFEALMLMKHNMESKIWGEGFKSLVSALTLSEDSAQLTA